MSGSAAVKNVSVMQHRTLPACKWRRAHNSPTASDAAGFTLLEVLISLLIMSIGLTGIAALSVHTLLMTRTTIARTHALDHVGDISERIRVNRDGLAAYNGAAADHGCDTRTFTAPCSAHERAEQDLFDWNTMVAAALPGGIGRVEIVTAAATSAVAIKVTWHEPGTGGNDLMRYDAQLQIAER
jgi:type IV pilus assembly protein PilV